MHGPPVDAEVLRDDVDRAATGCEQRHHELTHLRDDIPRGVRLDELPRITRHIRIRVGVWRFEIAPRAHDAVEVMAELDIAPEDALVHRAVARGIVREAHAPRLPLGAEERCQRPECDADRKLGRLAHRPAVADDQFLPQDDDVAAFLDRQEQRGVELPAVAHQRVDRETQRRLLAHQQPDRAEIRQPPRFRHQQPERLDAAALGGRLEQRADGIDRNFQLGVAEAPRRQPALGQHACRVEPQLAGDLGVVGKARAADEGGHGNRRRKSRKDKSMSR